MKNILVIGGGGALGKWEYDAACELIDSGIEFDAFYGTSAGALNAFVLAKGVDRSYMKRLYQIVGEQNGLPITRPRTIKITDEGAKSNGGLLSKVLSGVVGSAIGSLFGKKKVEDKVLENLLSLFPLMDNTPLYLTIEKIIEYKAGFDKPCTVNSVSVTSGDTVQWELHNFADEKGYIKPLVSSTLIPGLWELVEIEGQLYADGGTREGLNLDKAFSDLDPNEQYNIYVLACNNEKLGNVTELPNIIKILARVFGIMMNELYRNDLSGSRIRNAIAKELESTKYRYAPIHVIEYSGKYGSLSFSKQAFDEMGEVAKKDIQTWLQNRK